MKFRACSRRARSARAHAQPKGDKVTISGEVVDTWCYLEGGDRASVDATNAYAEVDLETKTKILAACQSVRPATRPTR